MKALGILLFISLITIQSVVSQEGISDYQFLTTDQELSQNTVSAIVQDQHGFLWLGTRGGLNKYDGINMQSYLHDADDSLSIRSNYVRSLYVTSDNKVLVGTLAAGYSIYDEASETFYQLQADNVPSELASATINGFYEDREGNIWFATERNGLLVWNKRDNAFSQYRHNDNDSWSISSNVVNGVIGDGRGNLWVATWGGGLNLFDTNTKRFIPFRHSDENPNTPISDIVRCINYGGKDHIWIGTDRGIDKVSYDKSGKYLFEHIPTPNARGEDPFVLMLVEDQQQRLWIGSENHGLCRVDLTNNQYRWFTNDSKSLYSIKNNSIWSVFEDTNGVIWVGTFNKGLFKLDESNRKLAVYKHNPYDDRFLTHNAISSFFEDKDHNVWIASDGGGLDYWDVKNETFSHYRKDQYPQMSDQVLTLMIDQHENVWVGSWQGGVLVKRKGQKGFKPFLLKHGFEKHLGKENVFSMMEDDQGRIWFAVFRSGLVMYDPRSSSFTSYALDDRDPNSISSNLTRHVYQDSKGRIWVGTEGTGLNLMPDTELGKFRRFIHDGSDATSLSDNTVECVLEDQEGRIWIGTSGGLNLYDEKGESFIKYGTENGFVDEAIHAIQADELGNLWLGTNKGIIRFNVSTGQARNFDLSDGIQAMEFFKNSSFKLSNGSLLFGGVDGFNVIDPTQIKDDFEEPQIYLADFKISNESIKGSKKEGLEGSLLDGGHVSLKYDQNDLSFEFSQINFSQSSKNEYAYILENYDREWQQAGNRREAYYTNVPPGEYRFRVKGTDNGGAWSTKEASFVVSISPAWYDTTWAHIVYGMLVLGILFWAFQTVVNRERLQSKLYLEHMELSKMQELDQMKSSFFANISHEFRSPLTLILGPLKAMVETERYSSSKEQASMMLRSAENLLNLINQLLELSKLESGKMRLELVTTDLVAFLKPIVHSFSSMANTKSIAYKVVLPKTKVELSFDKEKMEKVVVNLLSNAFKYTNDYGRVVIGLKEDADKVILEVEDDGIGIPEEEQAYIFNRYYRVRDNKKKKRKGTGIGLSLTKELVELHHGHVEFHSKEDEGTTFEVHLFKGKAHFDAEDFVEEGDLPAQSLEKQTIYELEEQIHESTSSNDIALEEEGKKLPLVLVVEDNADIRSYIKSILEIEYRVIEGEDGEEGIEKAKAQIPDLIISDVMMPGKDGFEVCREVKLDEKTSHIPVILLTAKASNDSALNGFELGADYYITKPFNPKLLTLRVRNALKTRDQIRGQLLHKNTFNIEPKNIKIASRDEEFMQKAVAVIESNMSNSEFYVDDLGRELGMSRMQLYRKLKGLIGLSANEFIRSIRLKRAAQLIRQDEMNISEITYQVGFNDLQYFRDCFKKQYGVNPSEYAQDVTEKTL
ncbi:response regulator [Reichenbachiella agarivorans]|uniref:histidine kinase n=1 Tax=Reichenbachiella agarivorans TaxID=2979464 RepID=A0ABY6CS54_9BACT|nr:two-component regulator propeller domain-containing protein [Reichenbachiella agarivorans]UXP32684.1 response regulator [Reichenbachiella agarivorans]